MNGVCRQAWCWTTLGGLQWPICCLFGQNGHSRSSRSIESSSRALKKGSHWVMQRVESEACKEAIFSAHLFPGLAQFQGKLCITVFKIWWCSFFSPDKTLHIRTCLKIPQNKSSIIKFCRVPKPPPSSHIPIHTACGIPDRKEQERRKKGRWEERRGTVQETSGADLAWVLWTCSAYDCFDLDSRGSCWYLFLNNMQSY